MLLKRNASNHRQVNIFDIWTKFDAIIGWHKGCNNHIRCVGFIKYLFCALLLPREWTQRASPCLLFASDTLLNTDFRDKPLGWQTLCAVCIVASVSLPYSRYPLRLSEQMKRIEHERRKEQKKTIENLQSQKLNNSTCTVNAVILQYAKRRTLHVRLVQHALQYVQIIGK